MNRVYFAFLLGLIITCSSCQKEPELTIISTNEIEISPKGGNGAISFKTNRDWSIKCSDSWIHVDPSSGVAADDMTISVMANYDANTTYEDRSAIITIIAEGLTQAIEVFQPANLGLIVPTKLYDLSSSASTIEVEVQSNIQYSITISDSWIKHIGAKSLTKNILTFSILENNTYDSRSASITIKSQNSEVPDQVISVKQSQKDAIIVEKSSYDIPYGGGGIEINVEANVSFDVKTSVDWIHYVETKAMNNSTIFVKVDENQAYDDREGIVEVSSKNGSLKYSIFVKQESAPGLFVNPTSFDVSYEAQMLEVEVKNNLSFSVEIPNEAQGWISIKSNTQTKSLTDDKVVFDITQNSAINSREASIVIKQKNGNLSKNVIIKQGCFEGFAVSQPNFSVSKDAQTIDFSVFSSEEYDVVGTSEGWMTEISRTIINPIETRYSYQISENTSTSWRNTKVTFKGRASDRVVQVSVSQEPIYYIEIWGAFFDVVSSFKQEYSFMLSSNAEPLKYSCDKDWVRFIVEEGNSYPRPVFMIDENISLDDREAIITIQSINKEAILNLNIKQLGVREVPEGTVELGLSVLWADSNIDAINPQDYGGYYAWGELEQKELYSWSTYKWSEGLSDSIIKYTLQDKKELLEKEDDIASMRLGDHWHIPTHHQWTELFNRCVRGDETINGVNCLTFTSLITGQKLYLPKAGGKSADTLNGQGHYATYWSSTRRRDYDYDAWSVNTMIGQTIAERRYAGKSIRPVYE